MKKTTIETRHFGSTEIYEEEIINFPNGILAFEQYNNFVILSEGENSLFQWLQSLEDPGLAFLIVDPFYIKPDYVPDVLANEIENLFGSTRLDHLTLRCIITIPPNNPDKMTVNMQGPLIISTEKKLGGQFISNNDSHHVRTPVLELVEAGEIA
ncbi:MAG: flagellar assembly protein FliW [Spirochaetia bacterium]|nr:flagellar assembly protein FliW [Spirochaetia bacterium]